MKVFVLLQHWNPESYGFWKTTILEIHTSKQSADDDLKRLEDTWEGDYDIRFSIQEHLITS